MTTEGILLLNLGTPQGPDPDSVGVYLREFLMDPDVVDIPWVARYALVNWLIIPKRRHASSELYKKIWTDRGSPLLFHTLDLADKVRALVPKIPVAVAMRYGEPSVKRAMDELRAKGVKKITAFPMYPQYSLAATESSVREIERHSAGLDVKYLPAFYANHDYLDAVAAVSRPHLEQPHDAVLFSFHGLPERQVKKTDATGKHCLVAPDCCAKIGDANRDCYRAQCFATAHALSDRLHIPKEKRFVAFQSRLGRTPWISPHSDELYRTLPAKGIKRLAVLCPSFVADCLETLEEVSLRGKEEFVENGGEELFLVPSLNASDAWASAVVKLLHEPTRHHTARSPHQHHQPTQ